MPVKIGAVVANFSANTTQGPIKFYDYQGNSWIVLFSHPADFTPVCTTELGRLAVHAPEFKKRNVKLLGLSVDNLKSHVDWVNDIKSYCKDIRGEFPYPIIADENSEIANLLDMIDNTHLNKQNVELTGRTLYVIDPQHIVRLIMNYPTSTGRNVDEIIRVIDSLQLVDRIPQIATPANWTPGEKVMILPHISDQEANALFDGKVDKVSMPSGENYVRTTTNYSHS
ncbi:peroxiredoxin-6-like [Agrilus planipennis]|uniref:1-Cys peroxiredoxin n=1 Tax=Agrilus planipennis TaxID=224129 RepID=A0A7F5RHA9_AGRPL|nr:peroxiredoxin-6-like [Agrilus planipennis]